MDEFLRKQEAVMDKYDLRKRSLECGRVGACTLLRVQSRISRPAEQHPGRHTRSLNLNIFAVTLMVRMATSPDDQRLQAMILTDKEKLV